MQNQPSTCDDNGEPRPRPGTIPDDFIWNAEERAWYPPGTPGEEWATIWARCLKEIAEQHPEDEHAVKRPHLISRDELLAAGALNVSPAGRKSRRTKRVARDQLALFGDDETVPTKQQPTPCDPHGDEPSEGVP
ncbi:MAG: hypothetical protein ACREHD_03180 [Pirellulales bacterium]